MIYIYTPCPCCNLYGLPLCMYGGFVTRNLPVCHSTRMHLATVPHSSVAVLANACIVWYYYLTVAAPATLWPSYSTFFFDWSDDGHLVNFSQSSSPPTCSTPAFTILAHPRVSSNYRHQLDTVCHTCDVQFIWRDIFNLATGPWTHCVWLDTFLLLQELYETCLNVTRG